MRTLKERITFNFRIKKNAEFKNKGTESDSDCYRLIGTLRQTIYLLNNELMNKQVTIDNLIDVIKNFTVIENKYTRNKEQVKNVGSKEKMMLLVSY